MKCLLLHKEEIYFEKEEEEEERRKILNVVNYQPKVNKRYYLDPGCIEPSSTQDIDVFVAPTSTTHAQETPHPKQELTDSLFFSDSFANQCYYA